MKKCFAFLVLFASLAVAEDPDALKRGIAWAVDQGSTNDYTYLHQRIICCSGDPVPCEWRVRGVVAPTLADFNAQTNYLATYNAVLAAHKAAASDIDGMHVSKEMRWILESIRIAHNDRPTQTWSRAYLKGVVSNVATNFN